MRKAISSRMEKRNISQNTLAKDIGVSVGVINKLLTGKEISFEIIWKILKYLEFENKNELLKRYIPELTKKNIKYAMEYFSLHGMHNELELLIEKANNGTSELREWARIYSKLQEYQKTLYKLPDPMGMITQLRRLDTPYQEIRMAIYLYEMYHLYYLNNLKILHQYLLGLNKELLEIDDKFLRMCFSARIDELMCFVELKYNDNPESARYYANRLLDIGITSNLNSTAHYVKAYSYIFEDFDKCVFHFKRSMEYYKSINRKSVVDELMQEMEIVYILWDKETEFTSELTKTLVEVKQQQKSPEELDRFINEETEPWINLFKGIYLDDMILLFSSFFKFHKKDDCFLSNFPKIELIKRGISEELFKSL